MSETVTFYCLRCGHRFPALWAKGDTKERSCPRCQSNSVRRETETAAALRAKES
ncbi:MAG: zinc ribbon domain-containing protein [Candidatus Eisenbacteria bacterium]|nr:zinc ribbon domain-containing protein [Candidatus Eisenbacteria bacterium]